MPGTKTSMLDTRLFRCAAYTWQVAISCTMTLPDEAPIFNDPEDAIVYFSRVKREYTVIDENVSGYKETFKDFRAAWTEFCKIVHNYAKDTPQLAKNSDGLYRRRYDLPDINRGEF